MPSGGSTGRGGAAAPVNSQSVRYAPGMRTLYITQRSPFARKVRLLMHAKNLAFEAVEVDLTAPRSAEFLAVSPLGKVPALVDEDGTLVFDSSVIAEYLEDRYPAPSCFGGSPVERAEQRALDELADTLSDQAITLFMKRGDAPTLERAAQTFERALDALEARAKAGTLPAGFGLGAAAVVSALGYVALRLGPERTARATALHAWAAQFDGLPAVQATIPRA
jgi:glutathione S-transferase